MDTNTSLNPAPPTVTTTPDPTRVLWLELRDGLIEASLTLFFGLLCTLLSVGVAYYGFVGEDDSKASACTFFAAVTAGACGRLGRRVVNRVRERMRSSSDQSAQA
ncbi:hypothetical protein [Streptomyces sp. NPDC052107]|uniref:hypothetical protein n=1 Tax=Streptomyces sp. NPDC052107 TaxID=3155632 RepID=UPI0034397340